jgi:TonB family protein
MMKSHPYTIRVLLVLASSIISPPSFCQSDPMQITAQDEWASPLWVFAPSFPSDVPVGTLPVTIRVEGMVTTDGIFTAPVFTPAEGQEALVKAVASVIHLWRFRPAIQQHGCTTKESPAVMIVNFGLKDGSPSVSMSSLGIDKSRAAADDARPVKRAFVRRPKTEFPEAARMARMEGSSDVLLELNKQGDVVKRKVLFSLPDAMFGKAATEALSGATFSKDDGPDSDDTTCVVVQFNFCLSGVPRYWDRRCSH